MASIFTKINRYLHDKRIVILLLVAVLFMLLRKLLHKTDTMTNVRETVIGQKNTKMEYEPMKAIEAVDSEEYDYGFNNSALMKHLEEFNLWMDSLSLQKVPNDLLMLSSCPACYGTDRCADISSGVIQIHYPKQPLKENLRGVYFGTSNNQYIVLKQLSTKEEYHMLDKYLCNNITHTSECDIGKAVISKNSFVLKEEAFLSKNLYSTRQISGTQNIGLTFALCATNDLISELSTAYDTNSDGKLSANESIMFWFSAVINPEPMIMQFLRDKFETPLPVAQYLGACGRAVVQEAVGRPLIDYLDESFNFRADIASQLMDLIDLFMFGDANWMVLWTDMLLDNLAVSDTGEVILIDAEDIVIINKKNTKRVEEICNWEDCIQPYAKNLMDISSNSHQDSCTHLPHFGENAMYLFLCHMLSDNPKHRIATESQTLRTSTKGWLHGVPDDIQEELELVFDDCTHESKPGGRVDAIYELKNLLAPYTYDYSSYEDDFDLDVLKEVGAA